MTDFFQAQKGPLWTYSSLPLICSKKWCRLGCQALLLIVGQPIAGRLVVPRWLPVSFFKLSESLTRYFWSWWWYTPPGCKPDASEPTLCYKASINNPRRRRRRRFDACIFGGREICNCICCKPHWDISTSLVYFLLLCRRSIYIPSILHTAHSPERHVF